MAIDPARFLAVPCTVFLLTIATVNLSAQRSEAPFAPPQAVPVTPARELQQPGPTAIRTDDPAKPRTAFNALPRGTQTFDGVTFRIQGPVNIIGARAAKAGGKDFARVGMSAIRGRGKHIHVLHTGDHGSSPAGNFIWRLVLHYADGESKRFDFAYGIHIRNFWRRPHETDRIPSDPDSSIVWVGTSVESDRSGAELVVSRTTLANPRPDVEVTRADFVSLLGPSSAYVFAVTLSDDGPKPVPGEKRSAPNAPQLTFVFQDAEGRVQANTTLDCVFECSGSAVRLARAVADAAGRVVIDVPTEVVSAIRYEARHPAGRFDPGAIEVSPGDKGWRPHVVRSVSE
jgi:hypothetical protein